MEGHKIVQIRIDPTAHKRFKIRCMELDLNMGIVTTELIEKWLEQNCDKGDK